MYMIISMRNASLFAAASLGCFIIAAMTLLSPEVKATNSQASVEAAQCTSLLNSYHDSGTKPAYGTPEYKRYAECYLIVCGAQLGW
ncbi:hypothetical protein [Aminobacter sp. LjRoot7]|uniref:hypothetical protein n=1 Tax=Aminobacter sp. LjRoot7 TaxID=3342335 RepID=UPI003ECD52A2